MSMPRMFELLKGKTEETPAKSNKEARLQKDAQPAVSFPRQIHGSFGAEREQESSLSTSKRLLDTVKKKAVDDNAVAQGKYNYALSGIMTVLKEVESGEHFDVHIEEIHQIVDTLTNQLILGDSLLGNVANEYSSDDYLFQHTTNVCILSLAVGMQMNFNKSKLHTLSIAAFFHDIGMLGFQAMISRPRELTDDEYQQVRNHIAQGSQLIANIEGPYKIIKEIIQQHHERVNGRGYPLGIGGDKINDYAKIIGLVDTYEAITHQRPHRTGKMPHTVIREIMGSLKTLFEPEIIKALVDKLSIYPVGSFVKLNNGEIAKVVSANPTSSLRPIVLVVLDAYSKHVSALKTIDLSKGDTIYIKEPVVLGNISC